MKKEQISLMAGLVGVAAVQAGVWSDAAYAQITTCDNPDHSECTTMLSPCGSASDGGLLWCETTVCYEGCC